MHHAGPGPVSRPDHPGTQPTMISKLTLLPAKGLPRHLMALWRRNPATREKVSVNDTPAWLLDIDRLRAVQREFALAEWGQPDRTTVLQLLAEGTAALGKPARRAHGLDGRPSCNWPASWWREELVRLKTAALLWLEAQGEPLTRGWFWPDGAFLGGSLSDDELQVGFARDGSRRDSDNRTQAVRGPWAVMCGGGQSAVALMVTEGWEGAPVLTTLPMRRATGKVPEPQKIAMRLWACLPADPAVEPGLSCVPVSSFGWPHRSNEGAALVEGRPADAPRFTVTAGDLRPRWLDRAQGTRRSTG